MSEIDRGFEGKRSSGFVEVILDVHSWSIESYIKQVRIEPTFQFWLAVASGLPTRARGISTRTLVR